MTKTKKKSVGCGVKGSVVRERDSKGRWLPKKTVGANGSGAAEADSGEAQAGSEKKKSVNKTKKVKEAREHVYENLPEIVKGLALKSGNNYLTAKFLFDFAKVEEVSKKGHHPGKPESMAGLLEQFGFADEKDDEKDDVKEPGELSCSGASKVEKS